MKKVHKEKGEKILNGLKQGIENELTESIEDYECTKESEKAENRITAGQLEKGCPYFVSGSVYEKK